MKMKIAKIVKCVISSRRMIIKATLATLVLILVVVIATSYYVNKEGFDDITNNLGSAINTVAPDTSVLDTTQLLVAKPLLTTPPPRLLTGMSGSGTVFTPPVSPAVLPSIQEAPVGFRANPPPLPSIKSQVEYVNRQMNMILNEKMSNFPLSCTCEHSDSDPTKAYNFNTLHLTARNNLNNIVKTIDTISKAEISSIPLDTTELIKVLNDADNKLGQIKTSIQPLELDFKFNDPDLNLLFRNAVRDAVLNVYKVIRLCFVKIQLADVLSKTTDDKILVLETITSLKNNLKLAIDNMNNAINKMNAINFVGPINNATVPSSSTTPSTTPSTMPSAMPSTTPSTTPSATPSTTPSATATPPSTTGSSPSRTDVVPEVKFSENGYNALMLQQKADILKDLQKVVRNEVLANRSTTPMLHNDGCGLEDDNHGCEPVKEHGCDNEDVPKNECGEKSVKDKVTAAISQGKEYENSCYKDKTARARCPPQPNMAQFIKKDAIPCWGCALDY